MNTDLELNITKDDPDAKVTTQIISTKRSTHFLKVLTLSFGSLGAVYGDIGTSPLYVMNSIKIPNNQATPENIYGCCSLIFWLFVIIVFFKYTLLVLQLGPNEGEGGQIAIYAKIARSLHFGPKGVRIPGAYEASDLEVLKRTDTIMSEKETYVSWKKNPKVVKVVSILCLTLAFLGCSLVISDGLLTPTTTALTAVSGIQVAIPSFTAIVGVSEGILVILFALQHLGSTKLSMLFAPIMLVWLLALAISGIYNIACYDATVFRSLSPHYAINLLKAVGIDSFGGAMLAITGTEAMFADIGHFGKLPIQIGISFTMICLVLAYLGQGAYLVKNPSQLNNVFYASIPGGIGGGFYWFMFVLAILSTVVASQALILGVHSIVSQLINLDCFPKLHVKRFSASHKGKVFIPIANILLLAGVCACTAAFQNSNNVTAAYGLGISLDFAVTSSLMAITMIFVYNMHYLWVMLYVAIFVPLEFCLIIANCKKVPHGAWFPLMMCAIFMTLLGFWRYCRDLTVTSQLKSRVRIGKIFPQLKESAYKRNLTTGNQDEDDMEEEEFRPQIPTEVAISDDSQKLYPLSRVHSPGIAIVFSDTQNQDLCSPNTFPSVYATLVRNFLSVPSVVVFCSLKTTGLPVVPDEEKILVVPTKVYGHYKAVARFGFTEQVIIDNMLLASLKQQLDEHEPAYDEPVIHIFEKNSVRNKIYPATRNIFKLTGQFLRRAMVEQVFSPINAAYQNDDHVVVDSNEQCNKLFVGSILRI